MPQPGMPAPRGEDWLVRKVQELERQVQQLAAANPFAAMGMKPTSGGLEIQGDLTLPSGIIKDDSLANPITGLVVSGAADGFALPGSASPTAVLITKTVTVPDGFTKAHVMASADMTAVNPTASGDYAFVRVRVSGTGPTYLSGNYTVAGKYSYVGSSFARVLTGLSTSFDITVEAAADTVPWAASDINVANLSAMVTFLR